MGFFDLSKSSEPDLGPRTDDRGRALPEVSRTDIFKQIWGEEGVPKRVRAYAILAPFVAFSGFAMILVNNTMTMRVVGMQYAALLSMAASLGFIGFLVWARGGKRFQAFGASSNQANQYSTVNFAFGAIVMLAIMGAGGVSLISAATIEHTWAYVIAGVSLVAGFVVQTVGWRRASIRQKCRETGQPIRPDAELRRNSMIAQPLMSVGIVVIVIGLTSSGKASLTTILMWAGGGLLLSIIGPQFAARRVKARNTSNPYFGSERLSAWLAANERCGACGYSLESVPVEPDGVRLCPECGCAWHQDRVTHAAPALEDKKRVIEALTRVDGLALDDRGVPLPRKVKSLGAWVNGSKLFGPAAEDLTLRADRLRMKRLREGAIAAGIGWCILAGLIIFGLDGADTGLIVTFLVILAVGGGITVLWYAFGTMPPDSICGPILARGLCPGCAASLAPALDAGQTFDGCINCPTCGMAWKRHRVIFDGTPGVTTASAAAPESL